MPAAISLSPEPDGTHLHLAGEVTAASAGELREAALAAAAAGRAAVVRGEAVERLDTAALQVLLALQAELRGRGLALAVRGLPAAVAAVVRLAGLPLAIAE